MKPNFALNLTQEAIVLLHRTARGWLAIGEAALDSADLAEALGYLRASALGLSPQGVTTKLILPNSQILYTEVDAPGPDAAARRRQVAAALEGLTPYPVEDLVFDTWGKGPRVQVAVVARETLAEAEAFVDQHRFNPVSFVAMPPAGSFGGEPFFGQTQAAVRLLAAGESVARDQDPVSIVSRDGGRDGGREDGRDAAAVRPAKDSAAKPAEATKAETPMPVAKARDAPQGGTADAPGRAAATAAAPVAASAPAKPAVLPAASAPAKAEPVAPPPAAAGAVARPEAAAAVPAAPDAAAMAQDTPTPLPKATPPVEHPAAAPVAAPKVQDAPPALPNAAPAVAAPPKAPVTPLPPALPPAAPLSLRATAQVALPSSPPLTAPPAPNPVPDPAPLAPVVPSFSSRRRDDPVRAPVAADLPPPSLMPRLNAASLTGAAPAPSPTTPRSPAPFTAPPPVAAPPVAAPPVAAPAVAAPAVAAALTAAPPAVSATPSGPGAAVPPPVADPAARIALGAAASSVAPAPAPVPRMPAPPTAQMAAKPSASGAALRLRSGAAGITAVGGPGNRPAKPQPGPAGDGSLRPGAVAIGKGAVRGRGKPRYLGLVLTGALLFFLMLVAAYSSRYLSRDDTAAPPATDLAGAAGPATGDQARPVAPAPVIVSAGDAVEPDPALLADMAKAKATPQPAPDAVAETGTPVAGAPPPATPEPGATVEPPPPAVPRPAAPRPAAAAGDTEVILSTASAATGQDEIFLSAVDAPPPAFDAVALPAPVAAPDAAPGTTAPPPPFGTVYQFDDQGRILAGATGVVVPGGFWLIAARPPVLPPPRAVVATSDPAPPDPAPPEPAAEAALPAPDATGAAPVDAPPATSAFAPDATVAPRRPQLRPAALTPPAVAPDAATPLQAGDGAALARDDPRHAGLRPRARSETVLARAAAAVGAQQAAEATQALAAASLVASAAAETATPVALTRPANASPLAVPLSRRPAARPRDFVRAVAAAAAEATQPKPRAEPEPDPEGQAASPEAEPEPEVVAAAAPRIPTRASVAKQATFANAINLSKVNLIGIYGTPSNRYAMVRTSGGRFTRVRVGDRVDGGTIAAITAKEIRYQKGGRILTLAMPRG